MDEAINSLLHAANAIGTFFLGVAALIGIPKLIGNLSIKNETLYGEEAEERYRQIKKTLLKSTTKELPTLEWGGGDIKVPRLELRKILFNSKITGDDWKGKKVIIKFYDTEGDKIIVKRWLL